ncbi:hypothetical protein GCM10007852_26470 [Agaribacter marinus]|uniref:DUF5916 domain-containing protein n=2 Tax=Agaribacter marinus TaxID=1431249 RepID=A0AA37T0N9_9ALTE|nr:hypothetical protein GCM10007852_26470 [Agaribacter marinus]
MLLNNPQKTFFRRLYSFPAFLVFFMISLSNTVLGQQYAGFIDGYLDEAHWLQAIRYDHFKVTQPYSLHEPVFVTEVLVYSDEYGLYVGFINQQNQSSGVTHTSLRDEQIKTDFNELIVDFDGQGKRAFGFKVSRNNAVQDSVWHNKNREQIDWNGNWLHGVTIDETHWQTELFIPWTAVISNKQQSTTRDVKLYFSRWHQELRQAFSYPAINRSQLTFMDEFKTYHAVTTYQPQLDYFPYFTLNHDLLAGENHYKAGMEVFWKPNNNQQINLSVNPDYGQVESNDLVINFSAIETFSSEKRPFFRENNELFDIWGPESLRVIHTPRIGGAGDKEQARDIDAAIRFTQLGEHFDVSILGAFEADNRHLDGRDFLAVRGQYKAESWNTGIIQTFVDSPSINRKAQTTAVDGLLEVNEQLFISAQLIQSQITEYSLHPINNTNAHHRTHINPKISDIAWWLKADFQVSEVWSNEISLLNYGEKFDISDFGFVKQVDRQQFLYKSSYEWPELESTWLRDIIVEVNFTAQNNKSNDDLPIEFELDMTTIQPSTAAWEFEVLYIAAGDDDLITRGSNVAYLPKKTEFVLGYTTAQDYWFQFEVSAGIGSQGLDGAYSTLEITPSLQIDHWMNVELEIEYQKFEHGLIWLGDEDAIVLDEDEPDYEKQNQLGDFAIDELSIALNVSAHIADKHEIRLKLEAVSVEADANQVIEVGRDNQIYRAAQQDLESFSESEFALQVRYRYEISALAEFYLVYSRGSEQEISGLPKSRRKFINSAINNADEENLVMKFKYHY